MDWSHQDRSGVRSASHFQVQVGRQGQYKTGTRPRQTPRQPQDKPKTNPDTTRQTKARQDLAMATPIQDQHTRQVQDTHPAILRGHLDKHQEYTRAEMALLWVKPSTNPLLSCALVSSIHPATAFIASGCILRRLAACSTHLHQALATGRWISCVSFPTGASSISHRLIDGHGVFHINF